MATTTKNLGLTLPEATDPADISVLNGNFQKIDEDSGAIKTTIAELKANGVQQTPLYAPGETVEEALAWLENNGDKSKLYVLPDGDIYAYANAWINTGHAFVPADYEERIVALEGKSAQVDANTQDIRGIKDKIPVIDAIQRNDPVVYDIGVWLQGGITSTGNVNTSTSRIRTEGYLPASGGTINLSIPDGLRLIVSSFDADKKFLGNSEWQTDRKSVVDVIEGCAYVRLMAAYTATNTTPITPEAAELADIAAHNEYPLIVKPALKILIIGNSFNQDTVAYLPPVLNEMLPDVDITYADCYTSSADIPKHIEMYQNDTEITRYNLWTPGADRWMRYAAGGSKPRTPKQALQEQDWDIILTNATTSDVYPDSVTSKIITPLRQLMRILQTDAVKPFQMMWFQVMGRDDDSTGVVVTADVMYQNHVAATNRVMDETGVLDYIPVGTALQNARTNATLQALGDGGNMLYSDNKHINAGLPALLATYTVALKIAEWYGRKTSGIYGSAFVPTAEAVRAMNVLDDKSSMTHGEPVGVTEENIRAAQEIAVMAVKHPDTVTDCSGIL